jgi:hypothetical protein
LALAAPFAAVTADAHVGAALTRLGVGQLPEENMPSALDALALPALARGRASRTKPCSPG